MSRTIVTPQCSVSPAGSGTIAYQATTSGSFSWSQLSAFQNYKYTATPAAGYRFVRFETRVVLEWSYHYYDSPGSDSTGSSTSTGQFSSNPHESNLSASGTVSDSQAGAYWYGGDYESYSYDFWISSISVVAVFEVIPPPPQGPYLLFDDSSGKLLYAPSNGQLIYGGNIT